MLWISLIEVWMVALFERERSKVPNISSFCKVHYLATWQPNGEIVMANVTVKGNWQRFLGRYFSMCFGLPRPYLSLKLHACKCTGHSVLADSISVNWDKWLDWCSRCWKKKAACQTCEHFIIETVCLSPSTCLSFTVCHIWLPSAIVCPSPTILMPTPSFQVRCEEPENDSLIISFQGVY